MITLIRWYKIKAKQIKLKLAFYRLLEDCFDTLKAKKYDINNFLKEISNFTNEFEDATKKMKDLYNETN